MGGITCNVCKTNFQSTFTFDKHKPRCIAPSFSKYEHKCHSCSKLFSCTSSLKHHIKTQHSKINKHIGKDITNKSTNIVNKKSTNNVKHDSPQHIINNITRINIGKIENKSIKILPVLASKERFDEKITKHYTNEFLRKLINNYSSQKMFIDLMEILCFRKEVLENSDWRLVYPST